MNSVLPGIYIYLIAEIILAHTVEKEYRRGDLLEKRMMAMEMWADYAASKPMHDDICIK